MALEAPASILACNDVKIGFETVEIQDASQGGKQLRSRTEQQT